MFGYDNVILQFDPESGVPLDQDGTSYCSSHMEVSFDNVMDAILNVSDEMVNLSTDETCCAAESSPIRVIVDSTVLGASESQGLITDSEVSVVQSNQDTSTSTTTICDNQENHTTLMRDIEVASHSTTPRPSPSRRLDFYDESDVLHPKRVNIQDSRNTVRYFSRSMEEKAFYNRGRHLKKKKATDRVAYAPPLPDIPVTDRDAESDVIASMRETVTEAGSMIREEVMAKVGQFRKWTGDKPFIMQLRGASKAVQDTVSVSQEKVKQSLLAFAELGTTVNGGQKSPIRPININESWEVNSTGQKASAFTFSDAIGIGCICVDPTCVDHDSTPDDSDEAIELPLNEHQRIVETCLEGNSLDPTPRKSSNSTFEQNVYIATTISESTTDSSESVHSAVQYDEDLSQVNSTVSPVGAGRDSVVCKGGSSKVLQRKPPENVSLTRKHDVVNGARRWNLAQRSPTPTPPKVSQFLELGHFPNVSTLQQPILDDDSCGDAPSTPPKCNRTAPMPIRPFANLKRSPSAKLKKQWSAAKLKSSPISTLDI
jgi:hypothetical protein